MKQNWHLLNQEKPPAQPALRTDWIFTQLLNNRQVHSSDKKWFVQPPSLDWQLIFDQGGLDQPLLDEFRAHLLGAIQDQRTIIIHGDYDVDGLCATALLWQTIYEKLGYSAVVPFIPHRTDHGYGVSKESLDEILAKYNQSTLNQPPLIITVDCGITATEAISYAQAKGVHVIITDHHVPPQKVPPAKLILHTQKIGGAGIAWILSSYMLNSNKISSTARYNLDLVALATICDQQPLLKLNRLLVQVGLQYLNQTKRLGLQELCRTAGLDGRTIGVYEVAWVIGPRLNAMGRLHHGLDSLRLLCTRQHKKAQELALLLNQVNQERQSLSNAALAQSQKLYQSYPSYGSNQIIILHHTDWHEGIIGLIASKMAEEYLLPSIIIAQGPEYSKGSARSIGGISIIEVLRQHEELFVDLGGHEMAAGFTIATDQIEGLKEKLQHSQLSTDLAHNRQKKILIDLALNLSEIHPDLWSKLKILKPHGLGNPPPVFLSQNIKIVSLQRVGKEQQHVKLLVKQEQAGHAYFFPSIGFNLASETDDLEVGDYIDLVYRIEENSFNQTSHLQLVFKDWLKRPQEIQIIDKDSGGVL